MSKTEWTPSQGEVVWIKVFSNWSKGTYIGYDVIKNQHLVREAEEGGGHLLISANVLPENANPNEPKIDKKQSSIDFLLDKLPNSEATWLSIYVAQAKILHEEEVIETARYYFHERGKLTPQQYYNKTFGGDNE